MPILKSCSILACAVALSLSAFTAHAKNAGAPSSANQEKLKAAQQDGVKARGELGTLLKAPDVYSDAKKKAAALKAALPLFQRIDAATAEITKWGPDMKWQIR